MKNIKLLILFAFTLMSLFACAAENMAPEVSYEMREEALHFAADSAGASVDQAKIAYEPATQANSVVDLDSNQ